MVPPVTQPLPSQPPQGAGSAVSSSNSAAGNPVAEQGNAAPQSESEPSVVTPPPVHQNTPAKPRQVEQPKTRPTESPKAKPVEQPKAQPKPAESKPVETKPVETKQSEPAKPVETPKAAEQSAPAGQAYVVQLGALKNAAKVSEIVAKLRLSGYRAFTVPSTPVQGQITRIYVGPDASKAKLQSSLSELQSVSGLGGVVKPYSAR